MPSGNGSYISDPLTACLAAPSLNKQKISQKFHLICTSKQKAKENILINLPWPPLAPFLLFLFPISDIVRLRNKSGVSDWIKRLKTHKLNLISRVMTITLFADIVFQLGLRSYEMKHRVNNTEQEQRTLCLIRSGQWLHVIVIQQRFVEITSRTHTTRYEICDLYQCLKQSE